MVQSSNEGRAQQENPASGTVEPGVTGPVWDLIRRLPRYAKVVASMTVDDQVPLAAKGLLLAAGAYLVSPVDAIPGIIPIAGQLDDLYVVLTGLQLAVRLCPPGVADGHFRSVGLDPAIVDDDLASIRRFVKRGVTWTLQRGSALFAGASRQVTLLATRLGQRGEIRDDQEPWTERPATPESGST